MVVLALEAARRVRGVRDQAVAVAGGGDESNGEPVSPGTRFAVAVRIIPLSWTIALVAH